MVSDTLDDDRVFPTGQIFILSPRHDARAVPVDTLKAAGLEIHEDDAPGDYPPEWMGFFSD